MSKKPTVVVVDGGRRGGVEVMTAAEARGLRDRTREARTARRHGRTLYRLRRHAAPWYGAGALVVLAAVIWAVRWITDQRTAVTAAVAAGCLAGFVGWLAGRRAGQWRHHVHAAAAFAALWLAYVAQTTKLAQPLLLLGIGTVALSARRWQSIRIPHPKAPAPPEPERPAGPYEQLWHENIADPGGALPKSHLSNKDTSRANTTRYVVNLRPGKQTITQLLGCLERIAGGLNVPVKRVVLEPHPGENPNQGLLTIVKTSPIDETVPYVGARIAGSSRHLIELGPYGDGDGRAPWRMWQPGERPMTGSWLSGFVVGGTGIGKSRLMELLAAGYMATGYSVVWFADPQGGASSPALQEYADWYVDSEHVPVMLAALERIAQWRETENSTEGWTRFDPSPERPGIVVFLDECHVTFKKHGARWADLARKTQKVGIAIVGLTQYASLENLGGQEPLRASLLTNAIVMKTNSKTNGQLIAGLDFDSEQLPKIPGFGYLIRADATGRTAPFRAEYLAEPEQWFERYPMPELDPLSVNAAGDPYQHRHTAAQEQQESKRRQVEQMRGARPAAADKTAGEEPAAPGVQAFPNPPVLHVVPAPAEPERPGRDRILEHLAKGPSTPKVLQDATGLKETRVRQLLQELKAAGSVEQYGRGLYRIAE